MTPEEITLATALGSCSFLPATAAKRFCRQMAETARNKPDYEISDRQRHYMQMMAWRFRRQLPARLVPANKPADLPPKESRHQSGSKRILKSGSKRILRRSRKRFFETVTQMSRQFERLSPR